MTQKEVMRKVISSISDELKLFDFFPSHKDQGFIRKTNTAVFFYQFLIYNRTVLKTGEKGFLIEPFVWVNVNEIEKYYKQITLNTVIKNDIDFVTFGNSIASLLANPDGLYKNRNKSLDLLIFNENDILYVSDQLVKKFKEVAMPYCLNNSNVVSVDKLANSYPNEYNVNLSNDNYRIIKGLIAAKLNNNPLLDKLVKIYDDQLKDRDMPEDTKEEMKRLKVLLSL